MSYVLSLIVAATLLGATQASSEEVDPGVSVRCADNSVTVGTSPCLAHFLGLQQIPPLS